MSIMKEEGLLTIHLNSLSIYLKSLSFISHTKNFDIMSNFILISLTFSQNNQNLNKEYINTKY